MANGANWWGGRVPGRYRLMALLADGRSRCLLAGIDHKTTALFYEQRLETWLDVAPRHVPGEVER